MSDASSFRDLGSFLDARLLRAVADLGFATPTPVQRETIAHSLGGEGRDVLARARTGSGKTLAYALPAVQKILLAKGHTSKSSEDYAGTRALILVPTRELSEQATRQFLDILTYCRDEVQIANVARGISDAVQKLVLSEKPDVVIATPSRALACLQSGDLALDKLETLVLDEADLILSYGHADALRSILSGGFLPRVHQTLLMSATLSDDVAAIEGMALRNPAVLRLENDMSLAGELSQFFVYTSEEDKFLLTYVILKLRLIRGKCLIFVNDIDRCYRVKLFLEQFGLRTCVLNEELPVNSRFHIVQEFNKGRYDYIIATDGDADGEYGVARGVDFVNVACVINFDLPTSVRAYTHRIGRTARAGNTGTALSYVVPKEEFGRKKVLSCPTCRNDEDVWGKIVVDQQRTGAVGAQGATPWRYDTAQVDAFRYRMEDALRAVTRAAIKEARIQEIKTEILNSKALKAHFEENPRDLEYLRHDKVMHPTRIQQHMRHVPNYLRPRIAGIADASAPSVGYVGKRRTLRGSHRGGKATRGGKAARGNAKRKPKKKDPLRTFT
ncbi:RNA helicase [Malassezia cuniculi]|uniref:RNA helicase n=1 Tax=Malassezia cuniculi TaxID=948313 RepID=A0AAF0J6M9_9BASI|nr:RNA helicase [Malassezia cuniculi]